MSRFVPRLIAPVVAHNKYYRYPTYYDGSIDGVNDCLLIDTITGAVMPNCVGYAWGRCYELLGSRPALTRGDAITWWSYNDGYPRSPLGNNGYAMYNGPKLGAIACMDGPMPYGHVAVVEKQNTDGSWEISESIYGGVFFRTGTIAWSTSAQKWFCWYDDGQGSYNPWDVKGFIYPPYDFSGDGLLIPNKRNKRRRVIYV